MEEIADPDERKDIYVLMMTNVVGVQPRLDLDPLDFFSVLHTQQEAAPIFMDEGIKLLDLCCGKIADLWKETKGS